MKERLLIIDASGHGRVLADIAMRMNKWKNIVFLDDNESVKSSMGLEVIGTSKDVFKYTKDYDVFVGIGNNVRRKDFQEKLKAHGANIPVLIHPTAVIGERVQLVSGTAVMAGVVINCCTKIGEGCVINTGSTIDHDNVIEEYVHVSPGVHLAGTVCIGSSCWLGIGSVVSNNSRIVKNYTIGAGAVVVKDITESGIYIGIPAKRV
ncbi:acetyltransferase [Bacillus pacificus]|uniref:acetyltransferase n=1 Tax=Bacillus pacificus TaxID=2026187 RepID=UPI003D24CE32